MAPPSIAVLSLFKRQPQAATPQDDATVVQLARTSARRRLIGAAVLLGTGVVGFPLLFETQPRPIPVDIAIEIPRKDASPPLATPPPRPRATGAVVSEPVAAPAPPAPRVGAAVSAPAQAAAPVNVPASLPAPTPAPTPAPKPTPPPAATPKPAVAPPDTLAPTAVAANADKPAPAASQRMVVQVGAFADAAAARELRGRVEKLGLKTYTQVVDTSAGQRIRVRVGPFANRAEADQAAARLRQAKLPASVLAL